MYVKRSLVEREDIRRLVSTVTEKTKIKCFLREIIRRKFLVISALLCCDFILFYFVLFYFISLYYILFHFILFHFFSIHTTLLYIILYHLDSSTFLAHAFL